MAFDQSTRGRLQKLVNSCRGLLSDEFSIQLQQTFGLDPKTGEVTPMARLTHLDDRQRHTADVLRQTLAHFLGADVDDTGHRVAVLDRMVREQAFTVLNRLAALLMMEARGQLIESVSKGYQSRGYQLYSKIAGTALGETGQAYQVYLFSVFDELAQELPALFDRYAANGLLFPRETALRALLEELNHFEIEPLWGEDETIGWIYQHFNSKEERKAMRKASKAPRDSRELAVRNQFFTPRYVVEYLIDNTLGRLWFNASGGQTDLRDRCQYLLVKPDEQPQAAKKLRDPRTLKLLDPACGSMHFGLYAFDLFAEIYREAWAWEQQHGPGSLDVSTQPRAALKPLSQTYEDEAAFLGEVPRMIIEHNIYGVDIDPRAAQIASLALWLRAQRAWHESGVKAKDRPLVSRGNVASAIAPPTERELRQQFVGSLDKRDGELFEKTLQLLKLLPELGVLLQVERELPNLVHQVYVGKGTGLFAQQEQETWELAEVRLREALIEFGSAANSTYQGRLFTNDALEGMRLIDICREKFDVIVMNPPFGDPSRGAKQYIDQNYPSSKGNLLANFIERSATLLANGGNLGAIVSRTCFFLKSFSDFRNGVLKNELQVDTFADLGHGVLDAMVETAAFVCTKSSIKKDKAIFFRHLVSDQKSIDLKASVDALRANHCDAQTFKINLNQFSLFSDSPYIYWIDESVATKLASRDSIEPTACEIKVGLQTGDDFRFLRLWYELDSKRLISPEGGDSYSDIQSESIEQSNTGKKWAWYSKTESAAPLISSIHLCVNWERNGSEIKAFHIQNGDTPSRYVRSEEKYFLPGISYMLRSIRLVPYVVPAGVIPTAGRSQVYPHEGEGDWVLMLLSSNLATCVSRFRGENFSGPKFQNSMVGSIPYVGASNDLLDAGKSQLISLRSIMAKNIVSDDSEILFAVPSSDRPDAEASSYSRKSLLGDGIEQSIASHFSLSSLEFSQLTRDLFDALGDGCAPTEFDEEEVEEAKDEEVAPTCIDPALAWKSYGVGVAFGRFDIRLATGERQAPPAQDPFEPLPIQSPGMLPNGATSFHAHVGILVDDKGHTHDLSRLIEEVLVRVNVAVPDDVRRWLQKDFFAFHLQRYSKSRRKAPIYWPLSTASGSYTLWIYYPSLNNQTLFTAVNDFLDGPNGKLTQISRECAELRMKGSGRSSDEEKQYETLQTFEQELTDLRDTLLKIAPTYQPKHDDGVQITAAPLWQLFRHKPWQKVLKDTWAKLEKGDYDWAHLAMAYWPDRVREKCKTDKSLAIAHGLEDLYVEPEAAPKKTRGKKKAGADE
jgi:hypothetical protein